MVSKDLGPKELNFVEFEQNRIQYCPLEQLLCLTHPYLVTVLLSQVLLGHPQTL